MTHAEATALDVMGAAAPLPKCMACGQRAADIRDDGLCILCAAIWGTVEEWRFNNWLLRNGLNRRITFSYVPGEGHYREIPDDIVARWEEERAWEEGQREVEPCEF